MTSPIRFVAKAQGSLGTFGEKMEETQHIRDYIAARTYDEPTLVLSTANLSSNYSKFRVGLPDADVHYAVKANPHPAVLRGLAEFGSGFDAASYREIAQCLSAGADPTKISFGNTVKLPEDITAAYEYGVDLFAADAEEELRKIARCAPRTAVYIRLLVGSTEAEWPLSRKFGCSSSMAIPLMRYASELGLRPLGFSFHVGSQTRHPHMWLDTLDLVQSVWQHAQDEGFEPSLLNLGGGFPSFYGSEVTEPVEYGRQLTAAVRDRFSGVERLMIEPGRGMAANLGCIAAKCLLVSRKTEGDPIRWVYLNVGRFSGLAETEQEAIKYRFSFPGKDEQELSDCIVAGPTCDSADVLYEKTPVPMPFSLQCGDPVVIDNCGAYTMTYSSVEFNGFRPLAVELME